MPKVTELRPLCPVTLTLKDGSVFTWDTVHKVFCGPEDVVNIWPETDETWWCHCRGEHTVGEGPQEAFDAMVAKARVGLAAVRDGKEDE